MSLKESSEGSVKGFGGRKVKGETLLKDNLENKEQQSSQTLFRKTALYHNKDRAGDCHFASGRFPDP